MIKIKSTAADGFEFGAYHADAQGKRKGGIVVIQEIFGIDQYVRADAERWANAGFEAIAPAMFDRTHPGLDVSHGQDGMAIGMAARQGADADIAVADITACVNYLKAKGPVFVVGYCYGGTMTWQAAGQIEGIAAASSYYGGLIAKMADMAPKCPIICHFGRKDAHIPADETKAILQAAQPQVPVYIYENSGHGFNNDGRPDSDPDDAALARKRTIALFEANGAG
jgi:carboxymethylenebutenolidase